MSVHFSIRRFAMALPLVLAACALDGEIGTDGQRLVQPMPGVDQAQVQRLIEAGAPRLQLTLVNAGVSTLLVRTGERDGVARWRTIDNAQIYTREGIVIGTRGFSFDLMSADAGDATAAIRARRPALVSRFYTFLDGDDRTQIRSYACDITPGGQQDIPLPEGAILSGGLVRERCHSPGEEFENLYLVRDGRIVQSLQFINQRIGSLQILLLP